MKKIILSVCLIFVALSVCFFIPKTNNVNAETNQESLIQVFNGTHNVFLVGKTSDGKLSLFDELNQCETTKESVSFYQNGVLVENQYAIHRTTTDYFGNSNSTGSATVEIPSSIKFYLEKGAKVYVSAEVGSLALSSDEKDKINFNFNVDDKQETQSTTKVWSQVSTNYIPQWLSFEEKEINLSSKITFSFSSGNSFSENVSKDFYIFNPTITFRVEFDNQNETEISIKEIVVKNKGFDGTTKAEIDYVVLSGVEFGENVSISGLSAEFSSSNVDATPIITGTPTILGSNKQFNSNYNSAKVSGTILKRDVVVVPKQTTQIYGASEETKIEYNAFNKVENVELEGNLAREFSSSNFKVNKYRIQQGTLNNENYNIILQSNTYYEIIKAEIILESIKINKLYDSTTNVEFNEFEINIGLDTDNNGAIDVLLNVAQDGLLTDKPQNQTKYLENERIYLNYGYSLSETNSGEHAIEITTFPYLTGTSLNSYSLKANNFEAKATIQKVDLIIEANSKTKTYGNQDPTLTYQIIQGNLVAGEELKGALKRVKGENVGEYAIEIGTLQLENPNYNISFINSTLTIEKRKVEIKILDAEKDYGEVDPTFKYEITSGSLIDGDSLQLQIISNSTEQIGEYELTLKTNNETEILCNPNYEIVSFEKGLFKINKNALLITIIINEKVYDGTKDATYNISYQTTSLDFNSNELKIDEENLTAKFNSANVGLKNVVLLYNGIELEELTSNLIIGEEKNNYEIEIVLNTNNAKITKRNVNVVVYQNYTKQFLEPDPQEYLFSQENVVEGEMLVGTLSRQQGEVPGTYRIILGTINEENNPNYNISIDEKYLIIEKRQVKVEIENSIKVYGEQDPTPLIKISTEKPLGENVINANIIIGQPAREEGENIGEYKYFQGTISLAENSKQFYEIEFEEKGVLEIIKREIKINIPDVNIVYGAQEFELTYEIDATSEYLPLSPEDIIIQATETVRNAKVYSLKAVANENYSIVPVYLGKLTVEQAKVTIKPTYQSKIYGNQMEILKVGNNFEVVSGVLLEEDRNNFVVSGNFERAAVENVGIYDINKGDAVFNSNYDVTFQIDQCFEILRRPIVVHAKEIFYYLDVYEKFVEGGVQLVLEFEQPFNLVQGEAIQGELELSEQITGVGTYQILQGTVTNENNPNYSITYAGGVVEIAKRKVTITSFHTNVVVINDKYCFENGEIYQAPTKIYDGTNSYPVGVNESEFTHQIQGTFVEDLEFDNIFDSKNIILNCNITKNVGNHKIQIELVNLNVAQKQKLEKYYELEFRENPIIILPREVTLTIVGKEFVYGGEQPSVDDLIVDFEKESYQDGTYDGKGILISKDENGNPKQNENGFVYEVGLSLKTEPIFKDKFGNYKVGEYKIDLEILENNPNYKLTVKRDEKTAGYFIIKKRQIKIDLNSVTKIYGEEDPKFTFVVTGDSILEGDEIKGGLYRHEGENIGVYEIVNNLNCYNSDGEINENYVIEFSENATLTIKPRTISVQLIPKSKIYDGTSFATVESIMFNIISTDNLELSFEAYFKNGDVGNNKPIEISNVKLSGINSENYTLSIPKIVYANITRKSITNGFVTITVEDDNTLLDEDVELSVKEVNIETINLQNKDVHKAFEILLLRNGEEITDFGGELTVEMVNFIPSVKEELLIIGTDKKISEVQETIHQKQITFKTTKLGTVLTAVEKNNLLLITLIAIGGGIVAIGIVVGTVVIFKKRKIK